MLTSMLLIKTINCKQLVNVPQKNSFPSQFNYEITYNTLRHLSLFLNRKMLGSQHVNRGKA